MRQKCGEYAGKKGIFPQSCKVKNIVVTIVQVCKISRLFRSQNITLPLPIAEQRETRFKTKKSIYSFFYYYFYFFQVLYLERCDRETLKLRGNKTREIMS